MAHRFVWVLASAAMWLGVGSAERFAGSPVPAAFALEHSGPQGGHYVQHNLVSDGAIPADLVDSNLVNSWGIAHLPTSPWWVADNGTGVSTVYDVAGTQPTPVRTVSIPGAAGPAAPTGAVANTTSAFVITLDGTTAPARFLFASEDGTLSAWTLASPGKNAVVVVDNSGSGAVYKGIAIASTASGEHLYATNFHAGTVETYDGTFKPVMPQPVFVDPGIPAGYAPFGIRTIERPGRRLLVYVTYALQDEEMHDDVAGRHHGFVSAFTPDGEFVRRVASRGKLDSPWGLALAPTAGFGRFSGKLLVGNFGDGHLIGYAIDGSDADERGNGGDGGDGGGAYVTGVGGPIVIDGLWGLGFGNGAAAGPKNALFFAAGPDGEAHGLFGRIDFVHGAD
jgi:uncharacterized protein (TIGR03118 family)